MLPKPSIIVYFLLLVTILPATPTRAEIQDIEDAINKSGRQRMLTQRMLRNFALVGLGIEYSDPKQDLRRSIDEFDRQLSALRAYKVKPQVTDALKLVAKQWAPIKSRLQEKPDKNNMVSLWKNLDELMKSSHGVVVLLTDVSKKKKGAIVNTSGRQRMLSQRMAGLYMLLTWRITDYDFTREFQIVFKEFKANHSTLEQSALTTDAIGKLLGKTARAFMWFEMMADSESDSFVPTLMLRSSDKILKNMDEATGLYATGVN